MAFEGGCFSYEFAGVQSDFTYRVSAGDFVSDRYAVAVRTRPGVREVKLTYVFPAYMNLPDQAEPPSAIGNISRADRHARPHRGFRRPPDQVREPFRRDDGTTGAMDGDADDRRGRARAAQGEIEVARSGRYRIIVKDAADVPNQPVVAQIVALPDDPPVVRVTDPGKDITLDTSAKLTVSAAAKDDFSLQGMAFFIQRGADKEWEKIRTLVVQGDLARDAGGRGARPEVAGPRRRDRAELLFPGERRQAGARRDRRPEPHVPGDPRRRRGGQAEVGAGARSAARR